MEKGLYNFRSRKQGFALAEIVLALFVVTIAVGLVAGLGQQVMELAKRSTQTGTVLELRSMVNSITRNPTSWIEKMRGSVNLNGIYAGCIPDPKLNVSTFSCPPVEPNLLVNDKELSLIAGSNFHVTSAPIVNSSGELIAGSVTNPIYLTSEGRVCENTNCVFKSTGYFLRSNIKSNEDPGSVKFVIKVERNQNNATTNSTPMKPQYLSVNIGEDWKNFDTLISGVCPVGTIKLGYLSNGQPSCSNPSKQCASADQYSIGTDNLGNTICKTLPVSCPPNSSYVLNAKGTDLECSANSSPCGENNLFLGYFGGSGEPMCSGSEIKCPANQLQVGIKISAGQMTAQCAEPPPSCTDANKRLSYNGEKFICESSVAAISCTGDDVMTGINSDGSPICTPVDRELASSDLECPLGKEMYGLDNTGKVKCREKSGTKFYQVAGAWPVVYSGANNQTITLPNFPTSSGPIFAHFSIAMTLSLPLNSGCTQAHGTGWIDFNGTHLLGTGGREPFAFSQSHNVMIQVTQSQNTVSPLINTPSVYCSNGAAISANIWLIGYTY